MIKIEERVRVLETDMQFLYNYLTEVEVSKLPLADRIKEHRSTRKEKPVSVHDVPKKGNILDEYDVLCIRNTHGLWNMYDPIQDFCEGLLYSVDEPKDIAVKCSLEVLTARMAAVYKVNNKTIVDVIRRYSWKHVSTFWNPDKGGKCHGYTHKSVMKKWNSRTDSQTPVVEGVSVTDGRMLVSDIPKQK